MLWPLSGKDEVPARFGSLEPEDVLDEYDGPVLFTFHGSDGKFLAYQAGQDVSDKIVRFLVVQYRKTEVDSLVRGQMPLLDALTQEAVWAIDQSFDGKIVCAAKLDGGIAAVPDEFKPKPGIRLLAPHHYH